MFKKLLGLLSDAAIYGASSALSQIISLFLLPLFTRKLTTGEMGILLMLSTLMLVYVPVATLGITSAVFRRFNLEKDQQQRSAVLSTGLMSILISSSVLLLIGQLFAGTIATYFVKDASSTPVVRLTLLAGALATVSAMPMASLRAQRRVRVLAGFSILKLLTYAGASIWFVVVLEWGVRGAVLGTLAAEVLNVLVLFAVTVRPFL